MERVSDHAPEPSAVAVPINLAEGLPVAVAIEAVDAVPRLNETFRVPIEAPVIAAVVLNGSVIVIVFVVDDVVGVIETVGVPNVNPAPTVPDLLTEGVPTIVALVPSVTVCCIEIEPAVAPDVVTVMPVAVAVLNVPEAAVTVFVWVPPSVISPS